MGDHVGRGDLVRDDRGDTECWGLLPPAEDREFGTPTMQLKQSGSVPVREIRQVTGASEVPAYDVV